MSIALMFTVITFDLSNKHKHMKNSMIKAFQIFKKGRTSNWVTILIPMSDFNDNVLKSKIDKYTQLGYEIKSI